MNAIMNRRDRRSLPDPVLRQVRRLNEVAGSLEGATVHDALAREITAIERSICGTRAVTLEGALAQLGVAYEQIWQVALHFGVCPELNDARTAEADRIRSAMSALHSVRDALEAASGTPLENIFAACPDDYMARAAAPGAQRPGVNGH
jgi:hypothetical protein